MFDAERNLKNHPPRDDKHAERFDAVTTVLMATAVVLNDLLPDGREKSLVFTKLEECSMWAKASLAREGR